MVILRSSLAIFLAFGLLLLARVGAFAASPSFAYTFEPHSAFFSTETHQASVVDPQVFVADARAKAGVGPQNIAHVAGYRPARPGSDAASTPLFNAQGKSLGLTLGAWLGATGHGTLVCDGNLAQVTTDLRGLVPGGLYQIVRLQFTPQGPKRSPLNNPDGSDSIFAASKDGTAHVVNMLRFCPGPTEGLVIAYHSDGQGHDGSLGELGVNLQNQLATRLSPTGAPPPVTALPRSGGASPLLPVGLGIVIVGAGLALRLTGRWILAQSSSMLKR